MSTKAIQQEMEVEVLKDDNITLSTQKVNNTEIIGYSIKNRKKELLSYFTKEEMIDRLNGVPPNKYGMMFQFLWRTGVRITECLNVRKKDIDFENNEIKISWLKSRKYLYRIIPLHSSLKLPLYTYTAKLKSDDRLFSFTRQYAFNLCRKYDFDHPHKLRHSFAVNFLRQSNSPMALVELKELLGHANIKNTMEYLRVVPMQSKVALQRINFD